MKPIKQDLLILQGTTFSAPLQWCSPDPVHKLITNVEPGLPTLVTCPGHGLTARTRVWITNVKGPHALNTADYKRATPRDATVMDADTLAIDFDTGNAGAYQSGGVLTYYPPLDLTGYTGRMQVRASIDAPGVLLDLTTENGGIVIDAPTGTIDRRVSAADSAALTFQSGVYDLELVDAAGDVTRLAEGDVCVDREVTRA